MSRSKRAKSAIGNFVFAVAVAIGLPTAHAGIISHNGSSADPSNPTGTDEVPVIFVGDSEPAPGTLVVATAFFDSVTHAYTYLYEDPEPPTLFIAFAAANNTAEAWSSYEVLLLGGDFFGMVGEPPFTLGDPARLVDPIETVSPAPDQLYLGIDPATGISVAGSSLQRDGENALLTIEFGGLVDPGEYFSLAFFINDVGNVDGGFIMSQTPTPIPEPAVATLLLLGAGAVGATRRRRR